MCGPNSSMLWVRKLGEYNDVPLGISVLIVCHGVFASPSPSEISFS
jgi:hypothetical protein